ncbi:helix-turn-helix domain-containing protein [Halobaculum roseum]|uniref:Helix-turn-helix domain-containing protein n=1 Tax=Halobaculum roseum TaxID=2175149 RepID=A0ABD5MMM1_9EURY|nr:helix-turn-helix domain-containing protein [Halobaculum roseum]QZY02849.1 helix-turn-helix domain-containing protein [Halobaculum roseum]
MRYLDATIDQPASTRHPMQAFIAETDAVRREELLAWQAVPRRDIEYALFLVEGDLDRYREAIAGVDSVPEFQLSPVDEDRFHSFVVQETRPEDAAWRAAFAERGLVVTFPVLYDAEGRMRLRVVGEAGALRSAFRDLPEGLSATVHHVGDLDHRLGSPAARLTARQREALAVAFDAGYYEVPRETDLDAVADELDCARATASAHLRKAERALVADALGAE